MKGLSIRSLNRPSSPDPPKSAYTPPKQGKENLPQHLYNNSKPLYNTPQKSSDTLEYADISLKDEPMEMKPKVKNPLFLNKSLHEIPIPKGNTAYSKAKRAEYVERDLAKAEKFYKIAIRNYERLDSAIKDLATVLHQQGKTDEACKFLEEYRHLYRGDKVKYENLLINLKKQIVPSGNCLNRTLVLFDLPAGFGTKDIKEIFSNSSRVLQIEIKKGMSLEDAPTTQNKGQNLRRAEYIHGRFCLIHFASYSAARKTLETLKDPQTFPLYWMNIYGKIAGKAEITKPTSINSDDNDQDHPKSPAAEEEDQNSNQDFEDSERLYTRPIRETKSGLESKSYIWVKKQVKIDKNPLMEKPVPEEPETDVSPKNSPPPRIAQKCWQNCVILGFCPSSEDSSISEAKADISQEYLLKRTAFKVFENEDRSWESFSWKRLLRSYPPDSGTIKATPLWEEIEKKEEEIQQGLAKSSGSILEFFAKKSKAAVEKVEKVEKVKTVPPPPPKNTTDLARQKLQTIAANELSKFFPHTQSSQQRELVNRREQVMQSSYERVYNRGFVPTWTYQGAAWIPEKNHQAPYFRGSSNPLVQNSFSMNEENEPYTLYSGYNKNF